MKKNLFVILFGAMVFICSCTSDITIELNPDYGAYLKDENVLSSLDTTFNFSRGRFMDKRKDPSKIGFYMKGAFKTNIHSSQAADEILFDGLKSVFVQSGHNWTDLPSANILVDIILLNMEALQTGFDGDFATARLQVQISFVDCATERVFYTNKYSGSSEKMTSYFGSNQIIHGLHLSLINCMYKVGNDLKLARAIINYFKSTSGPI